MMFRRSSLSFYLALLPAALGVLLLSVVVVAGEPLAGVDGVAITNEEVEKALGAQLQKLQEQHYNLKRQKVEAIIADRLLAQEAARCANAQGKFWAYHDLLYARAAPRLEQLRASAQDVGLDVAAFEQCVSSGTYQAAVQQDVEEGTRAGVTGTPTFFSNGRLLSGAQPLERFVQIIDEELAPAR